MENKKKRRIINGGFRDAKNKQKRGIKETERFEREKKEHRKITGKIINIGKHAHEKRQRAE